VAICTTEGGRGEVFREKKKRERDAIYYKPAWGEKNEFLFCKTELPGPKKYPP